MGAAGEERVSGGAVERRVDGPARRGEGEGLEPGGAALGEARQEDVGGPALHEQGVGSREVQQEAGGDPEPAVQTDGRKNRARWPSWKRRHDLGEVRREDVVVGHCRGLVTLLALH